MQKEKQLGLEKLQKDLRSSCLACNTMTEHLILMTTLAWKVGTHRREKGKKKQSANGKMQSLCVFLIAAFIFPDRSAKQTSLQGRQVQAHLYSLLFRLNWKKGNRLSEYLVPNTVQQYTTSSTKPSLLFSPPTALCVNKTHFITHKAQARTIPNCR